MNINQTIKPHPMNTADIYTSEDLAKLETKELIAIISDHSEFDLDLQIRAKNIIHARMTSQKIRFEVFEPETRSERAESSRIYRMMLFEEIERRKALEMREKSVNKADATVAVVQGRKKAYRLPKETLLKPDKNESIFKIKKQWANTGYVETIYSRDFPSERTWFEGEQLQMVEDKLQQEPEPYKFFDKGGLRKPGFNGFLYNKQCLERDFNQFSWFGIYLNNVLEQQPNGEFWSMEVFSWGKRG